MNRIIRSDDLLDLLAADGLVSREDGDRAARLARETGRGLRRALADLAVISDDDWARVVATEGSLPILGENEYPALPIDLPPLSDRFLSDVLVLPLWMEGEILVLAMADPRDEDARAALEAVTGFECRPMVGLARDIEAAIQRLYGEGRTLVEDILGGAPSPADTVEDGEVARLMNMASEAPVVRLVNLLLSRAQEAHASDVHIEPYDRRLSIRFRVDGVLHEVETLAPNMAAAVVSRIKIMADLDIAERRLPQDGRTRVKVNGRPLDLRVSVLPTLHGESVVLRLLERDGMALDFDALGFSEADRDRLLTCLTSRQGLCLVTGPTGSGKTTTLYAALSYLNQPDSKLISIEDPVEYRIGGVTQVQANPRIGLNFAQVLRTVVRQDPDVIMVGETRDRETAEIAVQSSLTGHLVLSTLHTNDAPSAVARLLDMGTEPYLLTATLTVVVGQRLMRKLCPHCRESYALDAVDREFWGGRRELYRSNGCDKCGGTGYAGRVAVTEVMALDDDLRRLVLTGADTAALRDMAQAKGMTTLAENGRAKVLAGISSVAEFHRAVRSR
ncbi:GspE/PulE family protein [Magnetospira sp. QH-2]|uniref:GspE/PulE family protein n=1 Tax=Magnetospira sp. (strain QH-2) TaxID=1288970 RepID=UPI0003E814E5|nr:GspE/PulE family protein [Magnetospira sp. QH-2]CCQ73347.1 General secretion pathway protein E (Type II traffic warden ATPase) [Magnetospira sp. QH-2]